MTALEKQILDYVFRTDYRPIKPESLARRLGLAKSDRPEFRAAIDRLSKRGRVRRMKNGLLKPRSAPDMIVGIIKRTARGGFLIPHPAPVAAGQPIPPSAGRAADIAISANDIRDAHTGDEALVRLLSRRRSGGQRCGRVEEILVRARNTFVGTYFEAGGQGYVRVDGRTFLDPIAVGDPGAKGARPNDKVVVEMVRFPMQHVAGEAVLTKVLGPQGEPGIDTISVIHEFGLPDEFPPKVLEAVRKLTDEFDEDNIAGRRDLTRETIVTIDPADARDFDDAISLTRSADGHWHLGVHIADVSCFVRPGSPLDVEARRRGTSVYLPGQVIPMLPEIISNGLASLQKGRVRYTKSAFIEFDPQGVPLHTELAESAIRVSRRLTYGEVLPIIHDAKTRKIRVSSKVRSLLARMYELAMILRRRRLEQGALELNLREVKIDLDADGRVIGAHETEHDESHQIIEEFMLAANIAVATELADRDIAFLRRIHPDPDLQKLKAFSQFVEVLGYSLDRPQSRPDLQKLLESVHGRPEERAVNYALLRSLKQAEYSPAEIGHYALAAANYCHFTSPIRRYPDLTIHRLVEKVLTSKRRVRSQNEIELTKLGQHCSTTERRAASAERELTKVKLLTLMADRIGEEMDAIITGVERFGLFCQGIDIPAEGMIHISALDRGDSFYHDTTAFSLIGRRSGKQYRLGDPIRVRIAHVDIDRRELDFQPVPDDDKRAKGGRGRKTSKQKKSAAKSKRKKSAKKQPAANTRQPSRGKSRDRRKQSPKTKRKRR